MLIKYVDGKRIEMTADEVEKAVREEAALAPVVRARELRREASEVANREVTIQERLAFIEEFLLTTGQPRKREIRDLWVSLQAIEDEVEAAIEEERDPSLPAVAKPPKRRAV
jgi:hypothetical protein